MDFKKICYSCMKEKDQAGGYCPYCGFKNEDYKYPSNYLRPLTPLNGKYLLGRALGAGGFGITYIALDLHLQVVVAVKELYLKKISAREESKTISVNSKDKTLFEDNKKRFLQEARVLAMFNEKDNEGVVMVKDHFEENNTAYIVMEYLDGHTLKELVKKNRLSFEQVRSLFEPVCHALTKIHQFGVVHLDISPDNIMIMDNNRAKLLDFGGARTIGAKDEHDIIAFKRGYAPPEQYMENGRLGQWTDVYATAATMYYCLTGVKPIDSMERKAGAELEKPTKLGAKISPAIETVILKAMEIDPSKRYQTMEEFWDALNNKKKKSKSDSGARQTSNRVKKNGGMAGIIIGVVAALIAAVVVVAMMRHKPKQESPVFPDQSGSVAVEETEEVHVEIGETMPMTLGTYIFENAADRNYIMGIDSGFGDDGTPLILKAYEDSNKNRVIITDEEEGDGFYNLRAGHTNSVIETSESTEIGETLRQFADFYDVGTQKWVFIYCGHDDEKNMDEVIIQNAAGSVMAPQDGNVQEGSEIVLTELNMEDDSQKWYIRWSELDESEQPVIVYKEGDLVESVSGVFNVASALDGQTSMSINRDETYHPEPTVVLFKAEWLTNDDTIFQFEFVPTGYESRYKIFPVDQMDGSHQCLEYNPDTLELVMRDESDNENQLFRIVYVKSNTYLIQTYNESVVGFDFNDAGNAEGVAVLARPYDSVEDSRLESWLLQIPHAKED